MFVPQGTQGFLIVTAIVCTIIENNYNDRFIQMNGNFFPLNDEILSDLKTLKLHLFPKLVSN